MIYEGQIGIVKTFKFSLNERSQKYFKRCGMNFASSEDGTS